MGNYRIEIIVGGQKINTLADILPEKGNLDILFIAKTPALVSVEQGHYFQGKQGTMFWNRLKDYGILKVRPNTYDDENLLENNFGITDIVKVPRDYGNEPSDEEYKTGLNRIVQIIEKYKPKVIVFVYKKVLDNILSLGFHEKYLRTEYGFNPKTEKLFGAKVFVFPMPGTPCTKEQATNAMNELITLLK